MRTHARHAVTKNQAEQRRTVRSHSARSHLGLLALAGLAVGSVAVGGTTDNGTGDDGTAATASSVAFLGKPSKNTSTGDASASEGLVMDLVRQFEAEPMNAAGYTGAGIDVAIIDTGVDTVPGLDAPGKVLHGPDLSAEGAVEHLVTRDSYGHGTHLAGIIAGNDGRGADGFLGMAPDARIISLKVAGADGQTQIPQVIAAIEWVIEHRNTDGLDIRVLNLALGKNDVPSNVGDPLSAAVERAWKAGIVVVVAAGNRGNDVGGVDSPAVSPYVISTGALNGRAVRDGVASWSSGGNDARHPDLVAPGRALVSLTVPGSTLEQTYPHALIDGRFMRGSGTSQAAAVMSGSVALLLSARPELTPDEVKYLLVTNANDVDRRDTSLDGAGKVRPDTAAEGTVNAKAAVQNHEMAMDLTLWDGVDSWIGGEWNGASWSGASWSGASWSGASWSGASWSGASWSGASWSGASWSGASWSDGWWTSAGWEGIDTTSWSWS